MDQKSQVIFKTLTLYLLTVDQLHKYKILIVMMTRLCAFSFLFNSNWQFFDLFYFLLSLRSTKGSTSLESNVFSQF